MPAVRPCLLLLLPLACAACRAPSPPPTDKPPEPQARVAARGTALRDAVQAPLQKAQGVQQQVLEGAERTRQAEAEAEAGQAADVAP